MKVHRLKISTKYLVAQVDGRKNFEVRYNDRDYRVGDILLLNEWENGNYTGVFICVKVTYVLDNFIALKDGFVVLGTEQIIGKELEEVLKCVTE
ncbi:DUF3850 domain-containing protein [Candidatus Stoquefichus sp. SB1]|uniref:DUF3850 domain-containing protein n=1 Tax=Candidatus Stoquefichus sp. SB1 TaxID=1658109 RepID=UPI00067F115B|nr:DUF3850 domain-containing protein [Candidatus Stoquefichus sp. SB1]